MNHDPTPLVASLRRSRLSQLLLPLLLGVGCTGGIFGLSNADPEDTTETTIERSDDASLLSAFYGLDDGLPLLAGLLVCGGERGQDGMPVVFSK